MKDETRQEISAAFAKDYTDWMVKTGGYAKDMTLRDHFAGLAMAALLGCYEWRSSLDCDEENVPSEITALSAYEMANAMLKERNL